LIGELPEKLFKLAKLIKTMENGQKANNHIKTTPIIAYFDDNVIQQIEFLKKKWNMKTRTKVIRKSLEKTYLSESV